jgi:uncharacterized membrane protein
LDEYVVSNSLVSPEVANNGKEPPRSLQRRRDRHHHHLLRAASSISSGTMWVNLHLLFWLSLMPFTTGWMGENDFARLPTMLYGGNLLACAIAYQVMQTQLARHHGPDSPMALALGGDMKGKISQLCYAAGTAAAAFVSPMLGFAVFVGVALLWLVPDRRMEHALAQQRRPPA